MPNFYLHKLFSFAWFSKKSKHKFSCAGIKKKKAKKSRKCLPPNSILQQFKGIWKILLFVRKLLELVEKSFCLFVVSRHAENHCSGCKCKFVGMTKNAAAFCFGWSWAGSGEQVSWNWKEKPGLSVGSPHAICQTTAPTVLPGPL